MPGFGKLDWDNWIYGLFYALIGGGASAVSGGFATLLVDPDHFNIAHPGRLLETMGVTFLIAGAISGFGFLKQKPLPDQIKTVTTSVEKTIQPGTPMIVATKVTETHVEPK